LVHDSHSSLQPVQVGFRLPVEEESIPKGNPYQQITSYAESFSVNVGFDSTNSLWLVPEMSYLEPADRPARETIVDVQPGDWEWESPLTVDVENQPKVGLVRATGSTFNGTISTAYAAKARNPSYKVRVDFGTEVGERWSSARSPTIRPKN